MGYNSQFVKSQPLNASFVTSAQQLLDSSLFDIQAVFTGSTCSFTAKLQVSSDPYSNAPGYAPTNWDDYPSSSVTITASGTQTWSVSRSGSVWVRVVVTDNSSGTNNGSFSATINVKGPL